MLVGDQDPGTERLSKTADAAALKSWLTGWLRGSTYK